MKHRRTIELFQYWNRLRAEDPAPKRTQVEPADIKALLPDTFILEEDQRGQPVFRLAGTRLCAVFGRELKGFVFSSLWLDKDRRLIARLASGAFRDHSVVVVSFDALSRAERVAQFEMLLLPLASEGDGARALGLMIALDKPFWIGIDPVQECRMTSVRVVDPEREPLFLSNRPAVEVPTTAPQQDALVHDREEEANRRVRHLIVLEGGLKD